MIINESMGYLLNTSARLIRRIFDKELKKYNVTSSQWAVLQLLFQKEMLSQAEIAAQLNSDRATCGAVVDKLVLKRLVKKQIDINDRRSFQVSLTSEGAELAVKIADLANQCNVIALEGFSKEEVKSLQASLNKIISNLSEETLWNGN